MLPLYADASLLRQFKHVLMPFLCLHAVVIKSLRVFSVLLDESVAGAEGTDKVCASFSVQRGSVIHLYFKTMDHNTVLSLSRQMCQIMNGLILL